MCSELLKTAPSIEYDLVDIMNTEKRLFGRKNLSLLERLEELLNGITTFIILLPKEQYQIWDFEEKLKTDNVEIHIIKNQFNRRVFFRKIDDVVTVHIAVNFERKNISVDFYNYLM